MAKVTVRAKHEFWAENDAELSLAVGDIITVLNRDDEGWWEGEGKNGQRGLFPSNYVDIIESAPASRAPPGPRPPATGNGMVKAGPQNGTSSGPRPPTGAMPIKSSPVPPSGPKPPSGPQPPKGPAPPSARNDGPVKSGVNRDVSVRVHENGATGKGA